LGGEALYFGGIFDDPSEVSYTAYYEQAILPVSSASHQEARRNRRVLYYGDALVRRALLMLLNEAARAHAEGVVRSARDGDVGAVLGFGFPPFLGGPLRYIDDQGAGAVVAELQSWAGRVGQRFAPCDALMDMARAGRAFHA
jgi:hypothetical protein